MKHTKGPWNHANFGWIHADKKHGVEGEACVVAQLHSGPDCPPAEDVAGNGALISAAPDLLESCKNLLELAATVDDHDLADQIRAEARRAISKAEGRQ